MAGEIRRIRIDEIVNYYENPRHAIAISEKDTLKKLFESVGYQYMLNLAEDIKNHGLLGNQQVVLVYSKTMKKYIVYEGNRRVAAIKLLLSPSSFEFLDKSIRDKAAKIAGEMSIPITEVWGYVTDEKEAYFIMERLHSGEDRGRGVKAWSAREKEAFKVRQNNQKSIAYLIDFYIKKYCNNYDITSIMPYTTIQRIFGNREVKAKLGLDINDESTFTKIKMELIVKVARKVEESARSEGISVTRLFNRARDIEDKIVPLIYSVDNNENHFIENSCISQDDGIEEEKTAQQKIATDGEKRENNNKQNENITPAVSVQNTYIGNKTNNSPYTRKLPYFFQGIDISHLNPNDIETHGIVEICHELKWFSEKKMVGQLPIAAVFLVRSAIEQSIIYYSKKHRIQGQSKFIWDNIKDLSKLSKIIDNYKKNLPNYIIDADMRQYFGVLFNDYEKNVDPLNWVVHRPSEFQLDTNTLIELPKKGLLTLINYFIS